MSCLITYQINYNDKIINCISYDDYQQLLDKYNNLLHEQKINEKNLELTIKYKDEKEELLRKYEQKINDLLERLTSNEGCIEHLQVDIQSLKDDKKDIETLYDKEQEKYLRTKSILTDIKNKLNELN